MLAVLGNEYSPLYDRYGVAIVQAPSIGAAGQEPIDSGATYSVSGYAYPECRDPGNWRVVKASDGKCYQICDAGEIAFEVDCPETKTSSREGVQPAAQPSRPSGSIESWMSRQDILQGVPNWIVVFGGAAIVILVANN